MKYQNNVAFAALAGVVVGALLGAGTSQYAQILAFYGLPHYAAEELEGAEHSTDMILRSRSDIEDPYYVPPRSATREQAREAELNKRESLRGSATSSEDEPEGCERFMVGGARYVKCVVEEREYNQEYQQSQTPR